MLLGYSKNLAGIVMHFYLGKKNKSCSVIALFKKLFMCLL